MAKHSAVNTGQTVLLAAFYVRDALCALDASEIQEVIRVGQITPVRHAPEEIVGIANLRGKIVTILDLGKKLGFGKAAPTQHSRIFILEDRGEFIGLLVDRVDEVVEVDEDSFESPPSNTPQYQAGYLRHVCRAGNRVISVLASRNILGSPQ